MIKNAEIINPPYSGEYEEKIYDHEDVWNSQSWSWVKFTDSDYYEWVGQFRGFPQEVGLSNKKHQILVLTSDYLFLLDIKDAQLLEVGKNDGYNSLKVAPSGEFILGYYYHISKIGDSLEEIETLDSPIQMDMIKFKDWNGDKLNFTCDEFTNWDRHLEMELNTNDWKISIKSAT
jgi:hypothetical protein